jgi:hypothetical protein
MTLNITRRRMLPVLAASVAFLPAVSVVAEDEVQALVVASQKHLVYQADVLARELIPALDGSSKDIEPWIEGSGYKTLASFTGETEKLARVMMDLEKAAENGAKLSRLGAALNKNLADLRVLRKRPGRAKKTLQETYRLLAQFGEIKWPTF